MAHVSVSFLGKVLRFGAKVDSPALFSLGPISEFRQAKATQSVTAVELCLWKSVQ
jgi:hypothetical protein